MRSLQSAKAFGVSSAEDSAFIAVGSLVAVKCSGPIGEAASKKLFSNLVESDQ